MSGSTCLNIHRLRTRGFVYNTQPRRSQRFKFRGLRPAYQFNCLLVGFKCKLQVSATLDNFGIALIGES